MSNDVTEAVKTNKPAAPEQMFHYPLSSEFQSMFQIFFLSQDQNQSVEVVETEEIDFEEIVERLKMGESVFIKNKNQKILEAHSKIKKEEDEETWYFTHC
ncbi:MAG TPA: hypothetical protein ENN36_04175 [Candidatus Bathyarchaeota archaeon]|nr:hypothetical protein [Candidatus Bathyarchaeota archaeon]